MTKILNHLTRDCRAASAAEFALVLPLLLLFLLGMLDVGRLMWTWNRAEKATQMGVRYAVVADLVASGIKDYSTLGLTDGAGQVLTQGDTLEDYDFGSATCEITGTDANASPTCGCTSGSCAWAGTPDSPAFTGIYNRMQAFLPELQRNDISVTYSNSGLGYAGDPNGQDFSPLVTVAIRSNAISFQPITLILFDTSIGLPSFRSALTMEDALGSQSN